MEKPTPLDSGRSCPLAYRYSPADLAATAAKPATTAYVVGGVYGNPFALRAVEERAAQERDNPTIILNGDAHYFDISPEVFMEVAEGITRHDAMLGNVEYVIGNNAHDAVGCGCDYPSYVSEDIVENSNAIVATLIRTARKFPEHCARVRELPRFQVLQMNNQRVGIVHGDLHSVAGWSFALENMDPPAHSIREQTGWQGTSTSSESVSQWLTQAQIVGVCSTHTGLPYIQNGKDWFVANNGTAGLPALQDNPWGLLTRISIDPSIPPDSLYGSAVKGLRVDAIPAKYDHNAWISTFRRMWPADSPAARGYRHRLLHGPALALDQADRTQRF